MGETVPQMNWSNSDAGVEQQHQKEEQHLKSVLPKGCCYVMESFLAPRTGVQVRLPKSIGSNRIHLKTTQAVSSRRETRKYL